MRIAVRDLMFLGMQNFNFAQKNFLGDADASEALTALKMQISRFQAPVALCATTGRTYCHLTYSSISYIQITTKGLHIVSCSRA